jgi:hypothetical protein
MTDPTDPKHLPRVEDATAVRPTLFGTRSELNLPELDRMSDVNRPPRLGPASQGFRRALYPAPVSPTPRAGLDPIPQPGDAEKFGPPVFVLSVQPNSGPDGRQRARLDEEHTRGVLDLEARREWPPRTRGDVLPPLYPDAFSAPVDPTTRRAVPSLSDLGLERVAPTPNRLARTGAWPWTDNELAILLNILTGEETLTAESLIAEHAKQTGQLRTPGGILSGIARLVAEKNLALDKGMMKALRVKARVAAVQARPTRATAATVGLPNTDGTRPLSANKSWHPWETDLLTHALNTAHLGDDAHLMALLAAGGSSRTPGGVAVRIGSLLLAETLTGMSATRARTFLSPLYRTAAKLRKDAAGLGTEVRTDATDNGCTAAPAGTQLTPDEQDTRDRAVTLVADEVRETVADHTLQAEPEPSADGFRRGDSEMPPPVVLAVEDGDAWLDYPAMERGEPVPRRVSEASLGIPAMPFVVTDGDPAMPFARTVPPPADLAALITSGSPAPATAPTVVLPPPSPEGWRSARILETLSLRVHGVLTADEALAAIDRIVRALPPVG